jgi:hypothetical protein
MRGPQVTCRDEPRAGGTGNEAAPSQSKDRRADAAAQDRCRAGQARPSEPQWAAACGEIDPSNDPATILESGFLTCLLVTILWPGKTHTVRALPLLCESK